MLAELFQTWKEEVEKASGTQINHFDRYKDRIVTKPDGTAVFVVADPPPRAHKPESIETLVALADKHGGTAVCWVSRTGVTLVLDDDADRRNTATMGLRLSTQMGYMFDLEKGGKAWSQKDLIQLLRVRFRGCGIPEGLVEMLRKVKFVLNTKGESEIQRGKTSVGKSHLAEYHGLKDLPEWITFSVPVWDGKFSAVAQVEVALDPDPESQTFRLIPRPGAIEKAIQAAEIELESHLREQMPEAVPVYYGAP